MALQHGINPQFINKWFESVQQGPPVAWEGDTRRRKLTMWDQAVNLLSDEELLTVANEVYDKHSNKSKETLTTMGTLFKSVVAALQNKIKQRER